MSRSYYRAGLGAMMFDEQLSRLERLEETAVSDLHEVAAKMDKSATRVTAGLVIGACVTGLSTFAILRQARKGIRP
jgi:hypothetical protein